jgi:predicted nucleotidyltransferase
MKQIRVNSALLFQLGASPSYLEEICVLNGITEVAVFGSALTDRVGPDSDIDLLITFGPGTHPGLLDHVRIEQELAELLGRPVDLVSKRLWSAARITSAVSRFSNPPRSSTRRARRFVQRDGAVTSTRCGAPALWMCPR